MKNKNSLPAGRQAVVLLSGGLDSSTKLYYAKKKGYRCNCLIFDYGQRHRKEIISAKKIAAKAKCPYKVLKIKFPWKGSSLLDKKSRLPVTSYQLPIMPPMAAPRHSAVAIPSTYVPARNIIFLSFAVSYAEAIGARSVFIGANAVDYSGYPDCRPEFLKEFQHVVNAGTKAGAAVKIEAPLIDKSKREIVELAMRLKVPLELTWSCYKGRSRPSGECDSCVLRAKGFREAGVEDPLLL
jgi:7-cyano-7-deazaguanine synthase